MLRASSTKKVVSCCPSVNEYSCLNRALSIMPLKNITASALAGEDEASLIAHEEWLIREGRKAAPDEKGIHERMTLTARKRLSDMAQMGIDAVRTRYPYLMDSQRVSHCCYSSALLNTKVLLTFFLYSCLNTETLIEGTLTGCLCSPMFLVVHGL